MIILNLNLYFTIQSYSSRYPLCVVNNFGTVSSAVDKFYKSVTAYITANGDEIDKINTDLDSYSSSFGTTGNKIIQVLTDLTGLINSINTLITTFVGNGNTGGIGDLLNCSI